MAWTQAYDPLGGAAASALCAAVPLLLLLGLLASGRFRAVLPAAAGAVSALAAAVAVWGMPPGPAVSAAAMGAAYGLFPILWIVLSAIWVYRLCVESGRFRDIRATLSSVTEDPRLQVLFIAFCFGAFLEGVAGFGTPVAITTAMLIGLGFDPFRAAALCLVANSAPVAFAAAGVPVTAAARVSGLPVADISRAVGTLLPLLSLAVPFLLVRIQAGWRGLRGVLPEVLVAGLSLALPQFLLSRYGGPSLAGVLSGLFSMAVLFVFLRVRGRRRAGTRRSKEAPHAPPSAVPAAASMRDVLLSWSPFLLMCFLVLLWNTAPVNRCLARLDFSFPWPFLDGRVLKTAPITDGPEAFPAAFSLSLASSAGTAIFLAGLASAFLLPGMGLRRALAVLGSTARSLGSTAATVCLVLSAAFVMNYAGMSAALGIALAATGVLFPFFAPLLGWLGVLLTGSDTSSNALFGSLQRTTADRLGLDPALLVAANTAGGAAGKMASPQSISVASAASGLSGIEGRLFRTTVAYSACMALLMGALVTVISAL